MSINQPDDPTGIITGDIKKISYTLYNQVIEHNGIQKNGFMTAFLAHYPASFHLIAEELNQYKYPESKRVINLVLKDIAFSSSRLYSLEGISEFMVKWIAENFNLFTKFSDSIELIFTYTKLQLFKEFVILVCKENSTLFFTRISQLFKDCIQRKDFFHNGISIVEKLIVISEHDVDNKVKSLWDYFLYIVEETEYNDNEEMNSLEGIIFLNRKKLNAMKAKYIKRNAFDQILDKMIEINDTIIESNVVHYGVERIIIGYL